MNAITHETQFTNNVISGKVELTLDSLGSGAKVVSYDSDDAAVWHEEYDFLPFGEWLQYRRYAAGNDNTWNTSDDPVVVRDEYTYDMTNDVRLIKFAEFVDDQTMRIDYSWTDRNLMSTKTYDNAGDDLMWNTPDDRGPQWREMTPDASGAIARATSHSNGGDGLR